MLKELTPYIYGATASVFVVTMNIFSKCFHLLSLQFKFQTQDRFYFYLQIPTLYFSLINKKMDLTEKNKYNYQILQNTNQTSGSNKFVYQKSSLYIKDSEVFKAIVKRLILGCIGIWLMNISLKNIHLGVSDALFNTGPVIMFFLQAYLLKKPLMKIHLILAFISFCGVDLIVNPFNNLSVSSGQIKQQNQLNLLYILLPILSAFASCLSYLFLHQLKDKVDKNVVLQYSYIFQVLYFGFLMNFIDFNQKKQNIQNQSSFQPSIFDIHFIGCFDIITILTSLSNFLRIKAMFTLSPAKIIPLNYFGTILSLTYNIVIFGHQTNFYQIFGIFLTSIGLLSKIFLVIQEKKQTGEKV